MIEVRPVPVEWNPDLPVFAKESFLAAVGDEHGWLGGFAADGRLLCVLPFTVVKKAFFRMVRFRTETIPLVADFDPAAEKEFLNGTAAHFKTAGAGLIIPASTNAIFRTYPDGAEAVPYGSYRIDLSPAEDVLWKNIDRIYRQNINSAVKGGLTVVDGGDRTAEGYELIRLTFRRSRLPFMDRPSFDRFLTGLGSNGTTLAAVQDGRIESYVVFAFSDRCAYAVYAGNAGDMGKGANKLIYWEAIRKFKGMGVRVYDFTGARIDPDKGSKQDALARFKKRFGAELAVGWMWRYSLKTWQFRLYRLAAGVRSGGDIVDGEKRRMKGREHD